MTEIDIRENHHKKMWRSKSKFGNISKTLTAKCHILAEFWWLWLFEHVLVLFEIRVLFMHFPPKKYQFTLQITFYHLAVQAGGMRRSRTSSIVEGQKGRTWTKSVTQCTPGSEAKAVVPNLMKNSFINYFPKKKNLLGHKYKQLCYRAEQLQCINT